jgi:hypothetical protein
LKNHSMIFDEFFAEPLRTKALINTMEMQDETYEDGVTYPNIAHLPLSVKDEIQKNMKQLVGPGFKEVLSFARYSFKDVVPPHWAHSDRNIAQFLALIYLNDDKESERFGTVCLRHKELGFETHPEKDFEKTALLGHANMRDEWEITFACPGRFNRCFILNADLIHAAMGEYGSRKEDGRLVVSVFFNLGNK